MTVDFNVSYKKLYNDTFKELALYKAAFDSGLSGKIILDTNFKIVNINKAALTILNISAVKLASKDVMSFFLDIPKNVKQILAVDKKFECISRLLDTDRYVNITIGNLNSLGFDQIILNFQDITKLKTAENDLIQQNSFARGLIATSPSLIYIYDLFTNTNIYITPNTEKILGISYDDLDKTYNLSLETFVHPDDIRKVEEHNERLRNMANDSVLEIELRFRMNSGTYRHFLAKESVFKRDTTGKPLQKIGTAIDITERKRTEELIKLHSATVMDAKNGMFITDIDGTIVWANKAFCDMMSYSLEELIGKNPRILKSGLHSKDFYINLWNTLLNGDIWFDSITNKTKYGGIISTKSIITPMKDEDGKITHFIAIKQLS